MAPLLFPSQPAANSTAPLGRRCPGRDTEYDEQGAVGPRVPRIWRATIEALNHADPAQAYKPASLC